MESFSKLFKKIGWLLFASAILFYDGHEFHEKFAVLNLTSNCSKLPLPKRFVSIIISLEVDIEEPTLQFWTTYLTSSEKPIESSEVLREVTGKWCSKIVESHLNFYQQQIQDYFRRLCNTKDGIEKSRDEFVEKTVTLLKLSLKAESSYIQQICEDRLRNTISKDETVQTFEPNLKKATDSCNLGMGSEGHEFKQLEGLPCSEALKNSQEALRQRELELLKQQSLFKGMKSERNQFKAELKECKNSTVKLQKSRRRLQAGVKEEYNLANGCFREQLLEY